jgi:hypothetical protein
MDNGCRSEREQAVAIVERSRVNNDKWNELSVRLEKVSDRKSVSLVFQTMRASATNRRLSIGRTEAQRTHRVATIVRSIEQ